MAGFSDRLRKARENSGLTIMAAAKKAGISKFNIEALESENFSNLPGKEEITKIIYQYASSLNINPDDVLQEFNRVWLDPSTAKVYIQQSYSHKGKSAGFTKKNALKLGALLTVMLLLGTGIYLWDLSRSADDPFVSAPENQDSTENSNGEKPEDDISEGENLDQGKESENENENEEQVSTVALEIVTTRGDCWLEVTVDNKRVLYKTIKMGEDILTFEGEEINVVFGNAGAVDVFVNGEPLDTLGKMQEVVRKTFLP